MEDQGEGGLEHVRDIQLMIILNNQEIKAHEQYILYKTVEIEKLSAKRDEKNKEITALEEKYPTLISRRIQSEESLSITNECLKPMSDHIIALQKEKEEVEGRVEHFKKKYADAIREFSEEYERMKKEYEENTPGYKHLKELQEKNTELEAEIKVLEENIKTEKKIRQEYKEKKQREFYNAMVQLAVTVRSYHKNKETFILCKQLEKEESQLLRKYYELQKQNLFKTSSFAVPKVPPPFQMPQLKFQPFPRALSNTNLMMSPRKYSVLQNEGSNHKGIIDDMKRRKLNPPSGLSEKHKRLNCSQKSISQFDASPYFQNNASQKVQNQNINQEHDSIKTLNRNHGKVKIIDVKVVPPTPAICNKNQNANNNNNTFIKNVQQVPLSTYNSNNDHAPYRDPKMKYDNNQPKTNSLVAMSKDPIRATQDKNILSFPKSTVSTENEPRNSQDLFFSQESVTNQFNQIQIQSNQTGLTPDMLQFKIPSQKNQIKGDENKENDENSNGQGTEGQPLVYNEGNCAKSTNNSFNIETSFRYENANNPTVFGQFDRPNEIPHFPIEDVSDQLNVSGAEMQNYMDTGNEPFVCSPIDSFMLNTSVDKEGNKDENKNKQSNNFFFKFGESASNNGSSGQNKLFGMFY